MELNTKRLLLRPVRAEDARDVYEYSRGENVGPNAGWKPHESLAETEKILKEGFLGREGIFGIILKESGRLIGTMGLLPDPKREYGRAKMLGYAIGEPYWGRGYMTEAALALIGYGFHTLNAALISANCYPFNVRSRRVLEKCGLRYEGTLRQAEELYDGSVYDHHCFSITREEWELRKR